MDNRNNKFLIMESKLESLLRMPAQTGSDIEEGFRTFLHIQNNSPRERMGSELVPMGHYVPRDGITTARISTQGQLGPSGSHLFEDQKKFEYFTGAQKRRIRAMIRNGMAPDEAKQMERERYAKVQERRQAAKMNEVGEGPCCSKKNWSNKSMSNDQELYARRPKQPYFGGSCGTSSELRNTVPLEAVESAKVETSSSRPKPARRDLSARCRVAIKHKLYPTQTLSDEQIHLIRESLLAELDRTENPEGNLGFVSSSSRNGWLSLHCHNAETKNWVVETIKRIQPYPNAQIEVAQDQEMPKNSVCIIFLPPEDVIPPEVLFARLSKQNAGLTVSRWKVLGSVKSKMGGLTVIFSVDEISKNRILAQKGKLFLNFSQIRVKVKESGPHVDSRRKRKANDIATEGSDDRPSTSRGSSEYGTDRGTPAYRFAERGDAALRPNRFKYVRRDYVESGSSSFGSRPNNTYPATATATATAQDFRGFDGKLPKWMRSGTRPGRSNSNWTFQ